MEIRYIVQFSDGGTEWYNSIGFDSESDARNNATEAKSLYPQFGWRVTKQTTEIIDL